MQLGWIIPFEDGDNTENRFRASRSASGISLSDGNTQLVEPSHAGLAFRRLGAELRASVLLTMANEQTAAIFEELHDWPAEIAVATAANQLPVLESFWDLAEMSPSLGDSPFACLCKQERVVVIAVFAADELISFASDISCRLDNMVSCPGWRRRRPKMLLLPRALTLACSCHSFERGQASGPRQSLPPLRVVRPVQSATNLRLPHFPVCRQPLPSL